MYVDIKIADVFRRRGMRAHIGSRGDGEIKSKQYAQSDDAACAEQR
jgi:hypothetical protein